MTKKFFSFTQIHIFFISLIICYLFWDFIDLKLKNPYEVISPLVSLDVNPTSNIIRVYAFSVISLFLCFIKNYDLIKFNNFQFRESKEAKENKLLFFNFLFLFCIISYLISFKYFPLRELDIMHDGQILTPAYTYFLTKKIWTGSFFNHGPGMDMLYTYFLWELFDLYTVGVHEFGKILLFKVFLPISLIIFLNAIIYRDKNFNEDDRILFLASFIFFYFLFFRHYLGQFDYREIFIFLPFSLMVLAYKTKYKILFPISFIFSSLSVFWSIDIGLIVNIFLFINLFTYYLFFYDNKNFILSFIFLIIPWGLFYYIFGSTEFISFIDSTRILFSTISLVMGRELPKIFTEYWITYPLIFLVISSITIVKKNILDDNFYVQLNLYILANLYIISIIPRFSSGHVKHAFVFLMIYIYYDLFNYINKILLKKINYLKKIKSFFIYFIFIFMIFFSIFYIIKDQNIFTFKKRVNSFVKLDYEDFLIPFNRTDTIKSLNYYKSLNLDDECVLILNNDLAFPYLLKKLSCTRSVLILNSSSKIKRLELLNDIKKSNPKIAIIGTPERWNVIDGMTNEQRLPEVFNYIYKHYIFLNEAGGRKFYIRK